MNKLKYFLFGVILTVVVYILWPMQEIESPDWEQIEELNQINDSLTQVNKHLDDEVLLLQAQADSLSKHIKEGQQVIRNLKLRKDEKILAIAGFHSVELFDFFANYKLKAEGPAH